MPQMCASVCCERMSIVFILFHLCTGPPPPPLNPVYHIQQYSRHNFTTIAQWGHPDYEGMVPDNYTISGTQFMATFLETNETTLTLPYNEPQAINITTNNCIGSSSAITLIIYEGKCFKVYISWETGSLLCSHTVNSG